MTFLSLAENGIKSRFEFKWHMSISKIDIGLISKSETGYLRMHPYTWTEMSW